MNLDQAYLSVANNLSEIGDHALEVLRARIEVEQRERDKKFQTIMERNYILTKLKQPVNIKVY